jgi:hypothetical protein
MKLLKVSKDGGQDSHVTGLFIFEIKSVASFAILKFDKGSREVFHSHAFNALTIWLPGADVTEYHTNGQTENWGRQFVPQFKWTPRSTFHKIFANKTSFAITIRGPWAKTWLEYNAASKLTTTLAHGRVPLN